MTPSRPLTGLSREEQSAYVLKSRASVDAVGPLWASFIAAAPGGVNEERVHDQFHHATDAFVQALNASRATWAVSQINPDALRAVLPESILWSYIRLAVVAFSTPLAGSTGSKEQGATPARGAADVTAVVAACLASIDSYVASTADRVVDDLLEGCVRLFRAVAPRAAAAARGDDAAQRELKFTSLVVASLASAAKKYTNRKKLYTTFCQRVLPPCVALLQRTHAASAHGRAGEGLSELNRHLRALVESCLFNDDKHLEDVSVAAVPHEATAPAAGRLLQHRSTSDGGGDGERLPEWLLQQLPSDGGNGGRGKGSNVSGNRPAGPAAAAAAGLSLQGLQKVMTKPAHMGPAGAAAPSSSSAAAGQHKVSYHVGVFHAVTSACAEAYEDGGDEGGEGLGLALAAVLSVYSRCSARLVEAQMQAQAQAQAASTHAAAAARAPPPPPSTTTLADRRKHVTRVLLVALNLVAAADNAYQRRLRDHVDHVDAPLGAAARAALVRAARAAAHTRRHVLAALSVAMDEAGGGSMLATHDALQVRSKSALSSLLCYPISYTRLIHDFLWVRCTRLGGVTVALVRCLRSPTPSPRTHKSHSAAAGAASARTVPPSPPHRAALCRQRRGHRGLGRRRLLCRRGRSRDRKGPRRSPTDRYPTHTPHQYPVAHH